MSQNVTPLWGEPRGRAPEHAKPAPIAVSGLAGVRVTAPDARISVNAFRTTQLRNARRARAASGGQNPASVPRKCLKMSHS